MTNLAGTWLSHYEYNSNRHGWSASSAILTLDYRGALISATTNPHDPGSHIRILLSHYREDNVLSGTWTERTDPAGPYAGRVYRGYVMFTIDPGGTRLNGRWLGAGADGEINTGPWTLARK